jgi:hypothetical protein
MYTAYVQCFNSSSAAVPIQTGVNQIFVDPSCRMMLKNHSLTSDLSMKLDAEVTYFPWKMADLKAFQITEEDIQAALEIKTTVGEKNLYLADVVQHKHFSSRFPKWQWVIAALIFTALVALAIFITLGIGTHRVFSFRRRMRRIRDALDQLRPAQPIRPPTGRPNLESEDPPLYPGLPDGIEVENYELMNVGVPSMTRSFSRSVAQLAKDYSKSSRLRHSSMPSSRRSSHHSLFQPICPAAEDPHLEARSSYERPTPMPRNKTPSYTFLKATYQDEKDNGEV